MIQPFSVYLKGDFCKTPNQKITLPEIKIAETRPFATKKKKIYFPVPPSFSRV